MKTDKKIRSTSHANTDKRNIFVTNGIFHAYKKRTHWKAALKLLTIVLIFPLSGYSQKDTSGIFPEKTSGKPYLSAFALNPAGKTLFSQDSTLMNPEKMLYTIQLCTFLYPLQDPVLQNNPVIHLIRVGDLYRYLYGYFTTLGQARQQLAGIQIFFPQACIREFRQGKLGQVIDMKINY